MQVLTRIWRAVTKPRPQSAASVEVRYVYVPETKVEPNPTLYDAEEDHDALNVLMGLMLCWWIGILYKK